MIKKWLAGICLLGITGLAHAADPFNTTTNTFGTGTNAFAITFVEIGNPGNPPAVGTLHDFDYYGDVDYTYRIGKYEVTLAQWRAFVANLGGEPHGLPTSAYEKSVSGNNLDHPAFDSSWFESAQFCNWLTSGDTRYGAYQFDGPSSTNAGNFIRVDLAAAFNSYDMVYVIPTRSEWFKAGYWKPTNDGYCRYPNGTDLPGPTRDGDLPVTWGDEGVNGCFGMLKNCQEWTEEWQYDSYSATYLSSARSLQMGDTTHACSGVVAPLTAKSVSLDKEDYTCGFRVAALSRNQVQAHLPTGHGAPIFRYRSGQLHHLTAAAGVDYSITGANLDGFARDSDQYEDANLKYYKLEGPAWLNISTNGVLSGTPTIADAGRQRFKISATNSWGAADESWVSIDVFEGAPVALAGWTGTNAAPDVTNGGVTGQLTLHTNGQGDTADYATGYQEPIYQSVYTTNEYGQRIYAGQELVGYNEYTINSADGTYGTLFGGATTIDGFIEFNSGQNMYQDTWTLRKAAGVPYADVTVTASNQPVFLNFIAFDWASTASYDLAFQIRYIGGDLSGVASNHWCGGGRSYRYGLYVNDGEWAGDEVPLVNLADRSLAPGESATFRIWMEQFGETSPLFVDNMGVIGFVSPPGYTIPEFYSNAIYKANALMNVPYTGTLTNEAFDVDGEVLTFSKVDGPDWLNVSTNGTLSGTPDTLDWGMNVFTVRVDDASYGDNLATLYIQVESDGTATPKFDTDSIVIRTGIGQDINTYIGDRASDPDPETLTFSLLSAPAWLSITADGTLAGIPSVGDIGYNTLQVVVDDGNGHSSAILLDIKVTELMVGWDTNETGPPTLNTAGLNAALLPVDTSLIDFPQYQGCTEDTYGTVFGGASGDPNNGSFRLHGGFKQTVYHLAMAVTNNSYGEFSLKGFSFDADRTTEGAPKRWTVNYVSGDLDLTPGTIIESGQLEIQSELFDGKGDDYADIDVSFTDLVDTTLAYGDTAVFEITVTEASKGNLTKYGVFIDNMAFIGEVSEPSTNKPLFKSDLIKLTDSAEVGKPYSSSIADKAVHPGGENMTFSRVSGPAWLDIATDGTLSGTPVSTNAGMNTFIVQVEDEDGDTDTAILEIYVMEYGVNKVVGWCANDPNGFPEVAIPGLSGSITTEAGIRTTNGRIQNESGTPSPDNRSDSTWGSAAINPPAVEGDSTQYYIKDKYNAIAANTGTITLNNNSGASMLLYGLHFDVFRDWSGAFAHVDVDYTGGDLGSATSLGGYDVPADRWNEVDASIYGTLADVILADGQSATFELTFSGGQSWECGFDNVGIEYKLIDPDGVNIAPIFTADPIIESAGVGIAYDQSLAVYASDENGDPLSFLKISGPDWLDVAADGTMSGTPSFSDEGLNSFVVQVSDLDGLNATAELQVTVNNYPYTVLVGWDSFSGSTRQWDSAPRTAAAPVYMSGVSGSLELFGATAAGDLQTPYNDAGAGSQSTTWGVTETGIYPSTTLGAGSGTTYALLQSSRGDNLGGSMTNTTQLSYMDITIQNTRGVELVLNFLVFDAWKNWGWNTVGTRLEYISGDLGIAPNTFVEQALDYDAAEGNIVTTTTPGKNIFDLSTWSDNTLGDNETATFRLYAGAQNNSAIYLDNIAILGALSGGNTPDADGDGIPDNWEIANFGDTTSCNAFSDYDGDGMIDLHEWMAGTSPIDAASALKMESAAPSSTNANVLVIQWQSVDGKSYRILSVDALGGSWSTNKSGIPATAPANTEPVTIDSACSFFRIELE